MGSGFITTAALNGLGRHEYYLTPTQQKNFEAIGWADFVQLFITCLLTKVSICLFLLRIVNSRKVTKAMYAFIAAMVLFTMVSVFLFLGICRPLGAHWSVSVQGVCFSKRVVMNIVIAHGGSGRARIESCSLLTTNSLICHFGFDLRIASSILSPKPSGQQEDQSRLESPDGNGCNVCSCPASWRFCALIDPSERLSAVRSAQPCLVLFWPKTQAVCTSLYSSLVKLS